MYVLLVFLSLLVFYQQDCEKVIYIYILYSIKMALMWLTLQKLRNCVVFSFCPLRRCTKKGKTPPKKWYTVPAKNSV